MLGMFGGGRRHLGRNDLYNFGHDGFNLAWREPAGPSHDDGGIGREHEVGPDVALAGQTTAGKISPCER